LRLSVRVSSPAPFYKKRPKSISDAFLFRSAEAI
jgi:hypothetical protein